jgi:hypothetical protein
MRRLGAWALTLGVGLVTAFGISLVTGGGFGRTVLDAFRGQPQIPTAESGTPRGDALLLMWASSEIVGTVGYCEKYVEKNPQLLEAAKAWNDRHRLQLEHVVEVLKSSGSLTRKEKDDFDRAAGAKIKDKVEAQKDRVAYCRGLDDSIAAGQLDLKRRRDTAEALTRIMKTDGTK